MDKIVFVDFDDTLFFTKHTVEKAAEIMLKKKVNKEQIRNLPKTIKSQIYFKAFNEFYKEAVPNKKLINILKNLKRKGYNIIILTARPKENIKSVKYLLRKYSVPFDEIIFRENLSSRDEEWKTQIIEKYSTNDIILFEDKLENIKYVIKHLNKPVKTFLVKSSKILKIRLKQQL